MSTLLIASLVMRASATNPYGWPRASEENRDDDSIFDHVDNEDLAFLAEHQGIEEDLRTNDPSIRQWKWPTMWSRTTTNLPIKPKAVSTTKSPKFLARFLGNFF